MRVTFTQDYNSPTHTYQKGQTYDVVDDLGRACVWRLKVAELARPAGAAAAPAATLTPATPVAVPPPPPPAPPPATIENT